MHQVKNSVIIIGAGIGGITASILLRRKGFDVEIYEKNSFPGGRCGQIVREGHRFDTGATILMMPSIYRDVFASLGLDFDKCFELKKLPVIYNIFFGGKQFLKFSIREDVMNEQLERIEKHSSQSYLKFISEGYGFYKLAVKELLGRNFKRLIDFITVKNILLLIKLKAYQKQSRYIRSFFRDERLLASFTFQNIYVGQNPLSAPALFAMLPAAELTEGALFPVGGMYAITQRLVNLAQDMGVIIHYGMAVSEIMVNRNRVTGLKFSNGTIKQADIYIANADLPYVYNELLPDKMQARKINNKQYSCSALVLHWGLKKTYPQLDHHNVFLSRDMEEGMNKIFKFHSIHENPSFYIHCPVRSDPSAAPEGGDTLSVIIPCGHITNRSDQQWDELIKPVKESVLRSLKKAGLEDIEENIKFEIFYSPPSWKNYFNVSKGSVFGSLKHNITQMGFFRPHNRHNRYRNLYFTGGSTHPGNGVPLVLLSGKLTAERIISENLPSQI